MNVKEELVKLADMLDKRKMRAEANLVDSILVKIASAPPPPAPGAPGSPNDKNTKPGDKDSGTLRDEKMDLSRLIQKLQDDPAKMSPQALNSIVGGILGQLKDALSNVAAKNPQAASAVQKLQQRIQRALS